MYWYIQVRNYESVQVLKKSNKAKRSHKAKKIADTRIQKTREEIQAAKDEALRLKKERAAMRKA